MSDCLVGDDELVGSGGGAVVRRSGLRVRASHSRTVFDRSERHQPVLVDREQDVDIGVVDAQRFPDRPPGGGVPPPHGLVAAARADAAAVVGERGTSPLSSWPSMGCQLLASHTRTVLSSPPDTSCRPSGLNATAGTAASCPRRTPTSRPVAASHNRMVLSSLPEAMRVPSGLNATLCHPVVVAAQRLPDRLPGAASHNRTVLSSLPEAMRVPSGLNATLLTQSSWPQRLPDRLPGARRPTTGWSCRRCRRRCGCRRG